MALGRVFYLPFVYFCFSFMLIIRLPFLVFVLHTLLMVSYGFLYWSELKQALGIDSRATLSYAFLMEEVGTPIR